MATSLIQQLHKLSVIKKGSFILKSGKKSDLYIDIRKAYGHPKILDTIAKLIIKKIPENTTCIACSGYGGLPLGAVISNKTRTNLTLVRDSAKKHGDSKAIEGYIPTKDDYVVIVDDIFSSGTGIKTIISHLKPTKAKILKSIVVIKRGTNTLPHPLEYCATEKQLR